MTKPMIRAIKIVAIGGVVLLACEEPLAPKSGGLTLRVLIAPGDNAALDSGYIQVRGLTNRSQKVTPGTTTTIDGLEPGTYTVALEGFAGGAVDHFGQTTGVVVKAGQNTPASVSFASFSTTLSPLPDSMIGKVFNVSFTAVPEASYLVEWTKDPSFASVVGSSTMSATTIQVTAPDYNRYYVRVRPIDPYQGRGPASSGSIRTVPKISSVKLAFTVQPKDTVAGQAIAPQVTIQDTLGRRVDTATSSVTIAIATNPTGATLGGTTAVSAVNGVATFTGLNITKAGVGYTLTASASGLTGAPSTAFTIKAGPPVKLAFTVPPPANATAGHAISPPVQVAIQDSYGNTDIVATNTVTIAIGTNPTGARLNGATANPSSGIATFSLLSIDRPDTGYTLVATSGTLTSATSASAAAHVTFKQLSAGAYHTCGLTTDSTAYCWGSNDSLQIGDSSTDATPRLTPAPVAGGLKFTTISAGGFHTCGVSGGKAYCWGYAKYGELGDGTFGTSRPFPKGVSGGFTFDSISAGLYHTCGITNAGGAYCWGNNGNGQLGDSSKISRPDPVAVRRGLSFVQISAGGYHTCGVATGDNAYCWGANLYGELGVGVDTTSRTTPAPVLGLGEVTAGYLHSCAVVPPFIGTDAYCWGNNLDGQVGDSSSNNIRTSPTQVGNMLSFSTVSAGGFHSCGVATTGGTAYCWGANLFGELGVGTDTTSRTTPTLVASGFTSISTGYLHTCGLATGPIAYCWGYNQFGELGDNTATSRFTPKRIVQ
jgi:alpha-tubulin suppressor-like RCC1 family protein